MRTEKGSQQAAEDVRSKEGMEPAIDYLEVFTFNDNRDYYPRRQRQAQKSKASG